MQINQILKLKKNISLEFKEISFDTRTIKKNDIFFSIKGNKTSGNRYIKKAEDKGASAIITDVKIKQPNIKIPIIFVKNARKSLSEACSNFYKKKPQNIIAVTGTNGKTSVASFFNQILIHNNIKSASIGTLGIDSKNIKIETNLTSMDPLFLHKNLNILKKKNINNVIIEASSHGLVQNRLDNIKFKTGIFTNLSHDHLDYHKNLKNYLNAKMYLFKKLLKKKSNIITDINNNQFKILKKISLNKNLKLKTIGNKNSDLIILKHRYLDLGQELEFFYDKRIYKTIIPIIGYFQIKNILMSVLAANSIGIKFDKIIKSLGELKPVQGRMEHIGTQRNNSKIIIDFAHTPKALEQALLALTKHFKNKISIVFGCGGERDFKKRSLMGKIANKFCNKIYITDDNPRNENAKKIRKMIIAKSKRLFVEIADRKKAINQAITELQQNEILLVAGKGHERFQDFGKYKIKFSDKDIIKKSILNNKKNFKKFHWKHEILKKTLNQKKIPKFNFNDLTINSREVKKNSLFLAIEGKKKDGHDYAKEAIKNGATKAIVNRNLNTIKKKFQIKIPNTIEFLKKFSKNTRKYSNAKIIGVTGSAGKTSLKNLLAFTLSKFDKVHSSPKSFNNHYGVPLSVSNLEEDTKFGVFEIGMSRKGEIDILSDIVRPNIAVITNISAAHAENFKNLQGIAKAKSEIIKNITDNGYIILNKDDKFYKYLYKISQKKKLNILSFSIKKKADIYLKRVIKNKNNYKLIISINNKDYIFESKFNFKNYIQNILSTLSILHILNFNVKKILKIFNKFPFPQGRGDISTINIYRKKITFIDESYNANPLSVKFAINNLNNYRASGCKKILILGDMLELGKNSIKYHQKISYEINKTNINKVYVYGKLVSKIFKSIKNKKKGKILKNMKSLKNILKNNINNNDILMIKGSNATGLYKISQNLKKGKINAL